MNCDPGEARASRGEAGPQFPTAPLLSVFLLVDNQRSSEITTFMRRLIVLRFAFASVMFSVAIAAQAVTGRVVGVSDGDTITLLDADKHQHKVRLAGIDAPESGQAFGRKSKQTLSDCAFGKQATLIGDKVDRYGRTVSKVMVAGVDCNLRQVVLGLAWHYKAYAREQSTLDRDAYANAELDARKARSGL